MPPKAVRAIPPTTRGVNSPQSKHPNPGSPRPPSTVPFNKGSTSPPPRFPHTENKVNVAPLSSQPRPKVISAPRTSSMSPSKSVPKIAFPSSYTPPPKLGVPAPSPRSGSASPPKIGQLKVPSRAGSASPPPKVGKIKVPPTRSASPRSTSPPRIGSFKVPPKIHSSQAVSPPCKPVVPGNQPSASPSRSLRIDIQSDNDIRPPLEGKMIGENQVDFHVLLVIRGVNYVQYEMCRMNPEANHNVCDKFEETVKEDVWGALYEFVDKRLIHSAVSAGPVRSLELAVNEDKMVCTTQLLNAEWAQRIDVRFAINKVDLPIAQATIASYLKGPTALRMSMIILSSISVPRNQQSPTLDRSSSRINNLLLDQVALPLSPSAQHENSAASSLSTSTQSQPRHASIKEPPGGTSGLRVKLILPRMSALRFEKAAQPLIKTFFIDALKEDLSPLLREYNIPMMVVGITLSRPSSVNLALLRNGDIPLEVKIEIPVTRDDRREVSTMVASYLRSTSALSNAHRFYTQRFGGSQCGKLVIERLTSINDVTLDVTPHRSVPLDAAASDEGLNVSNRSPLRNASQSRGSNAVTFHCFLSSLSFSKMEKSPPIQLEKALIEDIFCALNSFCRRDQISVHFSAADDGTAENINAVRADVTAETDARHHIIAGYALSSYLRSDDSLEYTSQLIGATIPAMSCYVNGVQLHDPSPAKHLSHSADPSQTHIIITFSGLSLAKYDEEIAKQRHLEQLFLDAVTQDLHCAVHDFVHLADIHIRVCCQKESMRQGYLDIHEPLRVDGFFKSTTRTQADAAHATAEYLRSEQTMKCVLEVVRVNFSGVRQVFLDPTLCFVNGVPVEATLGD